MTTQTADAGTKKYTTPPATWWGIVSAKAVDGDPCPLPVSFSAESGARALYEAAKLGTSPDVVVDLIRYDRAGDGSITGTVLDSFLRTKAEVKALENDMTFQLARRGALAFLEEANKAASEDGPETTLARMKAMLLQQLGR